MERRRGGPSLGAGLPEGERRCAGLSDASLLTSLVHAKGSLRWFMLKLVPSPSFDFFCIFFYFCVFYNTFQRREHSAPWFMLKGGAQSFL